MYDVQVKERVKVDGNGVIQNKIRQFYRSGAPRGFGDLGRKAIYFQGAGENLVIIFRVLGSKLIVLGI